MTEYRISDKMVDMKPSAIREIFKSLSDPEIIAFAAGNPAPESFPVKAISAFSEEIFRDRPVQALQYSITEGYPALRDAVKRRLRDRFHTGTENDDTIIVSGGQQGIELTAKVLCNEGDVVICEEPSFIGALNGFRSIGAVPVGVPLEEDGISLPLLEKALRENPRAKLLYLIPSFQNPAGLTMSLEKRRAVYDLALRYNVVILEDNPYGELRFAGEDVPTIKSMDTEGIVCYCGSFSKILSAGIRVGFLCAPKPLLQKIVVAKQVEDVHTNIFFQMICERFMNAFDCNAHIAKVAKLYGHKCGLMIDALEQYLPEGVTFTRPQGGLFLWLTLPDTVSVPELVSRALEKKVAVVPGSAFSCDPTKETHSIRLNYSTPSDEQITRGVRILSDVIRSMM